MTREKAKEIFNKVIKEKEKISVMSSQNSDEKLHNGINENVSSFLESYKTNKEKCVEEINTMKEKAEKLYEEVNRA